MRSKGKMTRKFTSKVGSFEPYEDGWQGLLCKDTLCKCRACTRPQQSLTKNNAPKAVQHIYQTNFGFSVKSAYTFVILHLRSEDNKNPITVPIPDVCLFHQGQILDLCYTSEKQVRGYKTKAEVKLRKIDIPRIFKQLSAKSALPSNPRQCHIARFTNNQFLMLSDSDLQQISYKNRTDPFWSKLQYIANRMSVESHHPISRSYSIQNDYPQHLIKLANESLVGYLDEASIRSRLDEETYLDFCNIKICNVLNYRHNIRVMRADFYYLKSVNGEYILSNVENIEHTNLTQALKNREQRLERELNERFNKIVLTPRRQEKLKHMEDRPMVAEIQKMMNDEFEKELNKIKLHSMQYSQNEQLKNEMAYKKMHPEAKLSFKELLSKCNFQNNKDELLGKAGRKPLIVPSKSRAYDFFTPKLSEHRYSLFRKYTQADTWEISTRKQTRFHTLTSNFSTRKELGTFKTEISGIY